MHTHARTHTCTQTQGQYNIRGGGGRVHPGVPALTSEKTDRCWRGRLPAPPPIPLCQTGRVGSFPSCLGRGGWKLPSQEQTPMGRDRGRNSLPRSPARAETSRVWFGLEGAMGRGLQQDEQAYESRGKSIQLLPMGWEVAPGERCQKWVGTSCKVLECQEPENPGGGRLKPLFSLTISLQLVGKLKEEVLVVDDLELAHVGLGL